MAISKAAKTVQWRIDADTVVTIFQNKRQHTAKGTIYAPGQHPDGSYIIFKLHVNYEQGGYRKTWFPCKNGMGLTLDQAIALLEKKVGRKLVEREAA